MTDLDSLHRVMKNLQREMDKIQGASLKGVLRGAVVIRRSMDFDPPLVPVDTGNLRQSWFVTDSTGGTQAMSKADSSVVATATAMAKAATHGIKDSFLVIMGFSANYAAFVHEKVGAHFQRPGAGAKFFEASIKRNAHRVLELIKEEARIK